jgi:hypothetical protein
MSKRNRTSQQAAEVLSGTSTSKPPVAATTAPAAQKDSIRRTIREGLIAGTDTKVIAATLAEKFPTSMAAQKATKHIAFYRSKLRKEGVLPKRGQAPAATA